MKFRNAVATATLCLCAGHALATDNHIPLNANWNGLLHPGEGGDPDDAQGFRSIADRALAVDGGANSLGTTTITGNTGITYAVEQNAGVLDIVHLGNTATSTAAGTCAGCPTRWWDQTTGLNGNRGVQPAWLAGLSDHLAPQATDVSGLGLTLDALSSIGVLYQVSNGGGSFQVVLTFTDSTSVMVTLASNDWFGPVTPPAGGAGVASQALMPPNSGARRTFTGASNTDLAIVQPYPTQDLGVVEGVISVSEMIADGLGNHAGKTLQSITFQSPNQPARGYAIVACTVVAGLGPPANDLCANAAPISVGTTAGENVRATGSITTCGTGDTKDVWYSFTAPQSGLMEARTCGSSLDTTLAVYAACGGSLLACNDNGCSQASRVQWNAVGNATYLVRVAANGGAEGQFSLVVESAPVPHNDIAVPLAYNWNGMVHAGEDGQPDAPAGFRSISDRAIHATGGPGSINAGPLAGDDFMAYTASSTPGALDIVHLGLTGPGSPRDWDATADGDAMGVRPSWLINLDQSGPQRTNLTPLQVGMGPSTRIGVLYNVSNGGGSFDATLDFSDGSSATVRLDAPDWYQDQEPPGPQFGVEVQRQLGQFSATANQDLVLTGAPLLNVVEAVFSTASLFNAGLGDHTGKRLVGLTFQNPSPGNTAGFAIYAATLRDAPTNTLPTSPVGSGTASPNQVETGRNLTLVVTVFPGADPASTGIGVTVDVSQLGGGSTQQMFDDGNHGDGAAGDNVFGYQMTVASTQGLGAYTLPFNVSDAQSRSSSGTIALTVDAYAWNENVDGGSDAGELPGSQQNPLGAGPLGALAGTLGTGDTDMFMIEICDQFSFNATTTAGNTFDSQLFLFNADGTGLSFSDDAVGAQSTITSTFVPGPGQYLLAVSQYDRDPIDGDGQELWLDAPFNVERQPDGLGAANPVSGWAGTPVGGVTYRIALTGACFPTVGPVCDTIDYNNDGLFPDTQDITDFITVFGGGPCSNDPNCNDIDFNNDGLFPDTQDIATFISVFGGGACL